MNPHGAPAGPSRVDVVFFDIDDTLYSTTAFAASARRNAVSAMIEAGLQVDLETGVTELGEVVAEFSSNYDSHFGRLLDRLGPQARDGRNPAVLIAAGVLGYHRTKEAGMRAPADVEEALRSLQDLDIRLGVISAGFQVKQAEKLVRLGLLRYFDPLTIFFTDQVGVGKPNPKLYTLACHQARVAPERAMYVGDRPTHDADPAHQAGLFTVHYTGAGGKYADEQPREPLDHRIADLRELPRILQDVYGVRARDA
jgi:putative hydrolase of the HAD superfamily